MTQNRLERNSFHTPLTWIDRLTIRGYPGRRSVVSGVGTNDGRRLKQRPDEEWYLWMQFGGAAEGARLRAVRLQRGSPVILVQEINHRPRL